MANSVNRPQWEAEVAENIQESGVLSSDFPVAADAGTAVIDPTAGSYEALLAGNACAAGALKFLDTNGLLIYIPTVAPSDRTP